MKTYDQHCRQLRQTHPALAEEFARFQGVTEILAWMQRRELTHARVDIVGQDEFEYDFLVELVPEQGWVAFGLT